jgi:hypothetical protein
MAAEQTTFTQKGGHMTKKQDCINQKTPLGVKKSPGYRNPAYLKWLKSQPCAACGRGPCDPAHQPSPWQGVGLKSPDTYCLPLCRPCHYEEHTIGHYSFWSMAMKDDPNRRIPYHAAALVHSLCLKYFTRFLQEGGTR